MKKGLSSLPSKIRYQLPGIHFAAQTAVKCRSKEPSRMGPEGLWRWGFLANTCRPSFRGLRYRGLTRRTPTGPDQSGFYYMEHPERGKLTVSVSLPGVCFDQCRFSTPSDKSDGSLQTKPEGFRIFRDVDFSRWRASSPTS